MEVSHQNESTEPEHRAVHLIRNNPPALDKRYLPRTAKPESKSGPDLASEPVRVVTPVEHDGAERAREHMDRHPGKDIRRNLSSMTRQPDRCHAAAQVEVIATKCRILDLHEFSQRRAEDGELSLKPNRSPSKPSKIKQETTFLTATLALQSSWTSVDPDGTDGVQSHICGGNLRTGRL